MGGMNLLIRLPHLYLERLLVGVELLLQVSTIRQLPEAIIFGKYYLIQLQVLLLLLTHTHYYLVAVSEL